ncbi:HAD-IIA family hydrolase [Litorihabitans aurantiacus]|uniref:Haloacid dehalogenase n=1 Tax=Litorihabitans aurantiacus TaxID=1930061 RepID=A0AA37XEC7_9MICO|nr:HAD hydrolase-like protein [Litorihabitans aurantiacus]GMA31653.1 haloacid dehalogenase [Litorihabitans aurantiacus]
MSTYLRASATPLAQAHDALLLDLDGVVYRGAAAVEHAADSIAAAAAAGAQPVYVTNNAGRPPQVVADQLTDLGIPTDPAHVMTSSLAAATTLARDLPAGSTVLCVGGPGLRQAMEAQGYRVVTDAHEKPDAVAQGYGPEVGWAQLTEAAYAIGQGARYVATNLDATLPTERGMAVGNGSLVAAVVNATGVRPTSSGKPEAGIFHEAAALVGATRPVVVGDRLDTDLAGARAAGMPGLQVLTGVHQAYDLFAAQPHERPDMLALDLRGVLEPHPEVVPTGDHLGGWRCRDAVVRVSGTDLHVVRDDVAQALASLTEITLDELRAACCAAWEAADGGTGLALAPRPLAVVV